MSTVPYELMQLKGLSCFVGSGGGRALEFMLWVLPLINICHVLFFAILFVSIPYIFFHAKIGKYKYNSSDFSRLLFTVFSIRIDRYSAGHLFQIGFMLLWLGCLREYFFYGIGAAPAQPFQCFHLINSVPPARFYISSDCCIIVCCPGWCKLAWHLHFCLHTMQRPPA